MPRGDSVRDERNQHRENFAAERTVECAEKKARIVELRRQRINWTDIGKAMGLSVPRCRTLYDQALAEIPAQHVDEHRAEELMLVDDATADLMIIAKDENVTPRSRIEAWSIIRSWAERKAKLLGLDAPTQVVRIDNIDKEIAELTKEMEAMAAAGQDVRDEDQRAGTDKPSPEYSFPKPR